MRREELLLRGMGQINLDKLLTIYGRNSVKEALENRDINVLKLHLSNTNKSSSTLEKILKLANRRGVEISFYKSRRELSFISKNSKQDQGVALDIYMPNFLNEREFLKLNKKRYKLLALDTINNPQNLGMIIRSATAGNIDAIILSTSKNSAKISPLVVKSSVGTIFKLPLIQTKDLKLTLQNFRADGAKLYTLSANAQNSYLEEKFLDKSIFVLGNESRGVSKEVENISDSLISVPMRRGVESLNVAVTASLIAFLPS